MIRSLSIAALVSVCLALPVQADTQEDEILRLPGQGEVLDDAIRETTKADRLKPGAGLFLTFDTDGNGIISSDEINLGIPAAFERADANGDGYLTALEQQDWAKGLPTRDDSLANPFRFDPNLDRRVDLGEFTSVIVNLGRDYADETSGEIFVSDLKAPRTKPEARRDDIDELVRSRQQRQPGSRNSSLD